MNDNSNKNSINEYDSIEKLFKDRKKESKLANTDSIANVSEHKKLSLKSDSAPLTRQNVVKDNPSMSYRAKIVRRRRIIALSVIVVLFLTILLIVIAGIKAIYGKLIAENEPLTDQGPDLSQLMLFREQDDVFYSGEDDEMISLLNQMFHTYTLSDDRSFAVTSKNEPSIYEWEALKYAWHADKTHLSQIKQAIKEIGISKEGYIWSEEDSSAHSLSGSYLYDNNLKFISAVSTICLWDGNDDFLYSIDSTVQSSLDVSGGKTVGEKLELAVKYVLENQYNQKDNLFYTKHDQNTGKTKSASSNYWMNFPFGYLDAYSNIYFNNAMTKLAKLYKMSEDLDNYNTYNKIALLHKDAFQVFWDSEKGRYIGSIDAEGKKHDYGFVFLNLEAIYYGLADLSKASSIFSWLDAERIISGDTSLGKDIYINNFAPRNTTVTAEIDWWNDFDNTVIPTENAPFGEYYQNGGSSLFVSFYDIASRLKVKGVNSAFSRFEKVLEEYKIDNLIRNNAKSKMSEIKYATNGNFPESGLMPVVFVYGFMGIDTDGKALYIEPYFPSNMKTVGIKKVGFSNNSYDILSDKDSIYVTALNSSPVRIYFCGFAPGETVLYTEFENDNIILTEEKVADGTGKVYIEEIFGKDSFISISKTTGDLLS